MQVLTLNEINLVSGASVAEKLGIAGGTIGGLIGMTVSLGFGILANNQKNGIAVVAASTVACTFIGVSIGAGIGYPIDCLFNSLGVTTQKEQAVG